MHVENLILTEPVSVCRAEARGALRGRIRTAVIVGFFFSVIVSVPSFLIFAFTEYPAIANPQEILNLLNNPSSGVNEYMTIYRSILPPTLVNLLFITLVTGPVTLGRHIFYLRYRRRQVADPDLVFSGFSSFGRAFHANLQMFFRIMFPTLGVYLAGVLISVFFIKLSPVLGLLFILLSLLGALAVMIAVYLRYCLVYFVLVDNPRLTVTDVFRCSVFLMNGNKGKYFLLALSFIGWYLLAWLAAVIASTVIAGMARMLLSESMALQILTGLVEQVATGFSVGFVLVYSGIAFSAFYEKVSDITIRIPPGYAPWGTDDQSSSSSS